MALPDSMQGWEVQWSELRLIHAVGRGSFGRVFVAGWHETEVRGQGIMHGSGLERVAARCMLELPAAWLQLGIITANRTGCRWR